jgi:oligopeptide/dipeptide ABC transporter ATP-binding protein
MRQGAAGKDRCVSALLEVEGLTRHFVTRRSPFGRPLATVKAVDGVDLTVPAGSTLALVGETGCGKSTVGRLILRLIEPMAGDIRFEGRRILTFGEKQLRAFRREAQIVFQDPYSSLNPRMTVGELIAEPLALHDIVPASRRRDRLAELLSLVGLDPKYGQRYPHEFSGGQRQRIAIARALAVEPKLIVCDEPVSALDVSIRSQVLNLLAGLRKRLALTYVFISHDLSVIKHIADRVAVMYLGRIVETAPADELFANPRHPYTRALFSAIPIPQPHSRRQRQLLEGDVPSPLSPPTGCHLQPRCAHAIERCRIERPALLADQDGHATACHRWRELPALSALSEQEAPGPRLERLMSEFTRKPGVGANAVTATLHSRGLNGVPERR